MGITRQQALDCFASDDLIGIGMEADAVRRSLHPEGVVSYGLDGYLDLQQEPAAESGSAEGLVAEERSLRDIRNVLHAGGTGISVSDGVPTQQGLARTVQLLRTMKMMFPQLQMRGYSASTILGVAERSRLPVRDILLQLHDAGLQSLGGDDAGILQDEVRQRGGHVQCGTEAWIGVHRAAHQLGMQSTASMTFGAGETSTHRFEHLQALRDLQDETGGFTVFELLAWKPTGQMTMEEATSVEFLKMLAISRMVVDNIENFQTSWSAQGVKVLQMALRFGSNDLGSLQTGKPVGGSGKGTTEEELRRVTRDAGFKPVQRDLLYRTMFLI